MSTTKSTKTTPKRQRNNGKRQRGNGQTSPREAFSILRSLEYLSEKELEKQLGYPRRLCQRRALPMSRLLLDPNDFAGVIDTAVEAMAHRLESTRPTDAAGQILLTKRQARRFPARCKGVDPLDVQQGGAGHE